MHLSVVPKHSINAAQTTNQFLFQAKHNVYQSLLRQRRQIRRQMRRAGVNNLWNPCIRELHGLSKPIMPSVCALTEGGDRIRRRPTFREDSEQPRRVEILGLASVESSGLHIWEVRLDSSAAT